MQPGASLQRIGSAKRLKEFLRLRVFWSFKPTMTRPKFLYLTVALIATTALALEAFAQQDAKSNSAYYVSPDGDDSNEGTSVDAPLKTIQRAVDAATPGTTVFVRAGVYRETVSTSRSGTVTHPVIIQNHDNEPVTINGADLIADEWTSVGNEVYRAPMPWNHRFENERPEYNSNQVFYKGQMMELVRWPNQTSKDPVMPTVALADSATFSKSDASREKNDLTTFHNADFNEPTGRWVGAKIWVNLSRKGFDGQGQTGTCAISYLTVAQDNVCAA